MRRRDLFEDRFSGSVPPTISALTALTALCVPFARPGSPPTRRLRQARAQGLRVGRVFCAAACSFVVIRGLSKNGFTGPVLRSTGVAYDIRKDSPYFAYDRVDFEVPVGTNGDNFDRYLVRLEEMKQSISIIRQCLKGLPGGPLNVDDPHIMLPPKELVYNSIEGMINHFKLIFEGIQVPAGEVYSYTEAANGELGFYIVSNGTGKPYKLRVRSPCFYFMGGIDRMIEGGMLSDIIPTFDTINMIGGEVDR